MRGESSTMYTGLRCVDGMAPFFVDATPEGIGRG